MNTYLLETETLREYKNAQIHSARYGLERLERLAPQSLRESFTRKRKDLERALNQILESPETKRLN